MVWFSAYAILRILPDKLGSPYHLKIAGTIQRPLIPFCSERRKESFPTPATYLIEVCDGPITREERSDVEGNFIYKSKLHCDWSVQVILR